MYLSSKGKFLNKTIYSVCLLITFSVQGMELHSYDAITQTLQEGHRIAVFIKSDLCQVTDTNRNRIPLGNIMVLPNIVIINNDNMVFEGSRYIPLANENANFERR